jgi:hypothetical protein
MQQKVIYYVTTYTPRYTKTELTSWSHNQSSQLLDFVNHNDRLIRAPSHGAQDVQNKEENISHHRLLHGRPSYGKSFCTGNIRAKRSDRGDRLRQFGD